MQQALRGVVLVAAARLQRRLSGPLVHLWAQLSKLNHLAPQLALLVLLQHAPLQRAALRDNSLLRFCQVALPQLMEDVFRALGLDARLAAGEHGQHAAAVAARGARRIRRRIRRHNRRQGTIRTPLLRAALPRATAGRRYKAQTKQNKTKQKERKIELQASVSFVECKPWLAATAAQQGPKSPLGPPTVTSSHSGNPSLTSAHTASACKLFNSPHKQQSSVAGQARGAWSRHSLLRRCH